MPNYSGISSPSLNAPVKKPGFFNRFKFTRKPVLYKPLINKNNARVPLLKLNLKNSIQKNGFVKAQGVNNTTNSIRSKTFEQNFLWELLTDIENSMTFSPDKALDMAQYELCLQKENLTEETAIFLYNKLIALYLLFFIHVSYTNNYNDKIAKEHSDSNVFYKIDNIKNINIKSLSKFKHALDKRKILARMSNIAKITSFILMPVLIISFGIAYIPFGFFIFTVKDSINNINTSIRKQTYTLNDIFTKISNIIQSPENKYKFSDLKEKLKFWGLNSEQIKVFETNATYLEKKQKYDETSKNLLEQLENLKNKIINEVTESTAQPNVQEGGFGGVVGFAGRKSYTQIEKPIDPLQQKIDNAIINNTEYQELLATYKKLNNPVIENIYNILSKESSELAPNGPLLDESKFRNNNGKLLDPITNIKNEIALCSRKINVAVSTGGKRNRRKTLKKNRRY